MRLNTIINGVIVAIVLIAIGFLYFSELGKRKLAERNLVAAIAENDMEMELTKRQAEQFYGATIDSLAAKLGVKPKHIVRWAKGPLQYRDTGSVVITPPRIDTVKVYADSITGRVSDKCYTIDILLYKGKFHTDLNYKDELIPVTYRERPKRIWFIKYGRWQYRTEILSSCSDSSIKVFNNVSIKGR